MTAAVLGAGSTLKIGLVTIAEVLRCGPIGSVAPEVPVTNLDSTAEEYIGGLPDGASLEFSLNFLDATTEHETLRDGVGTTISDMSMVFADATVATFAFVVLGFMRDETTPKVQLTATVSGRITGAIVWT